MLMFYFVPNGHSLGPQVNMIYASSLLPHKVALFLLILHDKEHEYIYSRTCTYIHVCVGLHVWVRVRFAISLTCETYLIAAREAGL